MEKVPVVILSHKRADRVLTTQVISNCIICIPEDQLPEYKKYNPEANIVTHPTDVLGLPAKRQWIFDHWGDVFMTDDDIVSVSFTANNEDDYLSPDQVYELIQNTYHTSKQLGVYLWGFGNNRNPMFYNGLQPFSLSGFVVGANIGMNKGGKLYFDMRTVACDDYWLSALNAYHHRKCFIDNRVYFHAKDTFLNTGGTSDLRTLDTEKNDTMTLRKIFGESIVLKKGTHATKLTHQFQRGLRLPF